MKCTRCRKETERFYALYELRGNLTKLWVTDICEDCDRNIADSNAIWRKGHEVREFKEVAE